MTPLIRTSLALAFLALGLARPGAAQSNPPPDTLSTPGRVELGGGLAFVSGSEGSAIAPGPQVTINFARRHAVQFGAETHFSRRKYSWGIGGLYTVLYRYTFVERRNTRAFVLAGALGVASFQHYSEHSTTVPAYTVVRNGVSTEVPERTTYYPGRAYMDGGPPMNPYFGLGSEVRAARRLIVQGQVGMAIGRYSSLAFRIAASAIVPIGRVGR